MCVYGGYKTHTITQIANILGALDAGRISLGAVRVYLAALACVAVREAAARTKRTSHSRRGESSPMYLLKELSTITQLPLTRVTKEMRALRRTNLISFTTSAITFLDHPHEACSAALLSLTGGRPNGRPVPLPRTLLRFLAKSSKSSFIKTALAYCVRGLTLSRTGEISGKGSVKATTLAKSLNLSERSVRSARAALIDLSFITGDEASFQRKLNRTGAYFTVNLSWIAPDTSKGIINRAGNEGTVNSPSAEGPLSVTENRPVDNSRTTNARFAPLGAKNSTNFAPPYKDKKTLFRSKNQKTHPRRLNPSGLCIAKNENPKRGSQRALPPPNIRDVRAEDLRSFGRVEELYRQAVRLKLIEPSEATAINFIGAAARATRVEGDAPRIFMGIVRGKLWKNINQADEDRALGALRRYRAENPDRFRLAA